MKTTLNAIRKHSPCADGWQKLLAHLGKTKADNAKLSLLTILESNGLDDALWCLRAVDGFDREKRLFAVWCARQVEHLNTDPRVKTCNDTAERFANGNATQEDLDEARDGAWAAWAVARDGSWAAVGAAARDGAWAAGDAAWAAWDAARDALDAQKVEFIRMLNEGYK